MGFVENSTVDSKRSWCLLSVVFFSLFGAGGLQMSFGTILGALVDEFGESTSKIGLCRAFSLPSVHGQRAVYIPDLDNFNFEFSIMIYIFFFQMTEYAGGPIYILSSASVSLTCVILKQLFRQTTLRAKIYDDRAMYSTIIVPEWH